VNPTVRMIAGDRVTADEAKQILTVLDRSFGQLVFWVHGLAPPLDCLWWKMRDAPWGSSALVLEVGSRIVGFMLMLHRRVLLHGNEWVVRDGCDLAIDPDFQGRGLYRVLQRASDERFEREFDFVFTYETHSASQHLGPERGAREFGNSLQRLSRPLDIARVSGGRPFYRPGGGSRWYARLGLAALRRAIRPIGRRTWSIARIERFDDRIDAFCKTATAPFALVHKRTVASLNWRFCDPRGGPFTVLLAEHDARVLGYIVVSAKREMGYIADVIALPERLDVVDSLVGHAIGVLKRAGATTLRCRLPAVHPYNAVLRRHGLTRDDGQAGAVYRPRRLDAQALSPLADPKLPTHVMFGDSDHV
jgi:GNAT superfamily N-acetyltransferase